MERAITVKMPAEKIEKILMWDIYFVNCLSFIWH